ncbi:MAG: CHASE4 domain-containing protein [Thermodesulfobacteriota bacterium]|nr:CHASE4 domain-containing protein [Thermodesulfobacteriota bacterium]
MRSLQSKVAIILLSVFVILAAMNYGLHQYGILPIFLGLERDEAIKNVQRCIGAIEREIHHLDNLCWDWSAWNDTYAFVETLSNDYIEANLSFRCFSDNELNLIYIIGKDGKVIWSTVYDLGKKIKMSLSDFPKDFFSHSHPLLSQLNADKPISKKNVSGILMTERGLMLISSRPIITSNNEGPIRGALILGRFINNNLIKTLVEQTQVTFDIDALQGDSVSKAVKSISERLQDESPHLIERDGPEHLMVHTYYPDIKGDPALLINVKIPRKIYAKGYTTLNYALISFSVSVLVMLLVVLLLFRRTVLTPIKELTLHTLSIERTGDLSVRLSKKRKDEIGTLAREFDGMVTQLERRSTELTHLNSKLENDIILRKKAETSLLESEKRINRLKKMEAIGLMAGGVAHDLNNILSGIVSYPDLILMNLPEESNLKKPLEAIKNSGQRAAAVVADLLTLSRGVVYEKNIVNLNEIVNEYLLSPEHKRLMQIHSFVTVKTDLDQDLINIKASPFHMRKVIMNLVINALEAISGKGTVTLSTRNQYLDAPIEGYSDVCTGEYAKLTVSDDGEGICSEDIERVFEPFYTKKIMGRSGTGLGLALVWNTVQDHEGYINVTSGKEGTAFELYFRETKEKSTDKSKQIPLEECTGNGEKVLVVDDDETQREIACGMLTKLGYSAVSFSNGEETVEYLKEHTVNLIVLDMIMDGGMSGKETYEKIIQIHPGQKAIITSGFSETDDVRKAQKLGAGQYIKKPYTLMEIGIAIRNELKRS